MIVRVRLPAKATSGSANPKLNAASRMWPLDVAKLSPVTVTWVATAWAASTNPRPPSADCWLGTLSGSAVLVIAADRSCELQPG